MRKQRSQFGVNPDEELDLQHQGSLGGQQLVGKYGTGLEVGKTSSIKEASKEEGLRGGEPAKGPGVAMTPPSQQQREKVTPERMPKERQEQKKATKQHHYK